MKFVRVPRTTEQNADQKFLITTINRGMRGATYNPDFDIFRDLFIRLKRLQCLTVLFKLLTSLFYEMMRNKFESFKSSKLE